MEPGGTTSAVEPGETASAVEPGGTASAVELGGTISARNAQVAEVSISNHVISALHMAQNVKVVAKPTTEQECVTQSPSEKYVLYAM